MTPQYPEDFARRATHRATKVLMFGIFAVAAFFIFGEIVHLLWNWLMPVLFHLSAITFWQGIGLMVLSWLLFGGLRGVGRRGPGPRAHWRRRIVERMQDRWEHMTPEEREKFREWVQGRCGQVSADASGKL